MSTIKSVELYFTNEESDKRYNVYLDKVQDGFVVNYEYGKRNAAVLRPGTKTATPVDEATATKIYEKLLNDQFKQGYTTDVSGKPFLGGQTNKVDSGFKPQLLNEVKEGNLDFLLDSPDYAIEEKFDGKNTSVRKDGSELTGINKLGLVKEIPDHIKADIVSFGDPHLLLSGELVDNTFYYVFDVVAMSDKNGQKVDLTRVSYLNRMALRDEIVERIGSNHIFPVEHAIENKREFMESVEARKGEGVVFKRIDSIIEPGKNHETQYKHKFYEECSAIVGPKNIDARSVRLRLMNELGDVLDVGNVTIPQHVDIPAEGSVLEVTYLYAYEGGSLYQPIFKEIRDDVDLTECLISQLKYKAEHVPPSNPKPARMKF